MNSLAEWVVNFTSPGELVLDVGCGDKRYSNYLKNFGRNIITVDAWENVSPDVCLDVTKSELPFENNSVDHVIMLDFIEHLEKSDGEKLIESCKKICKKSIFIFTPGWWSDNAENVNNPQLWCYGNNFDYHLSLWSENDLKDFEFYTLNGFDKYVSGIWRKQ